MARRSRAAATNVVRLDLSKVETRARVKPGEYESEVVEVTQEKGDKAPYLKWVFEITEGDSKGGKLFYNTSLSENSLWNLRGLLEALDVEIPDSEFDLDLKEMVGLGVLLVVEEGETYTDDHGRTKKGGPAVVDFEKLEDAEKPTPKSDKDKADPAPAARRGSKKALPQLTQDEVNDMSQDELEEVIEEYKLNLELSGTLRKMKAAVIDALDEAKHLKE